MKTYTITVNGTKYEVTVEEGQVAASSAPVAPAPAQAAAPAGPQGGVKITAPMSGKILAIKAPAGTAVKKGQCIITFEAMKMENEVVADRDGVVASINCAVNDKVEQGAVLATLK